MHSVLGGLGAATIGVLEMMVFASIIDTFGVGFGPVFVSGNCLSDFSWISISILRIGQLETVDIIVIYKCYDDGNIVYIYIIFMYILLIIY